MNVHTFIVFLPGMELHGVKKITQFYSIGGNYKIVLIILILC